MKEIFDWLKKRMNQEEKECEEAMIHPSWWSAKKIVDEAEAKWEADCCEWKWGIDYAQVQCKGDKILFYSRRLFTYCPYCGKKISEVE